MKMTIKRRDGDYHTVRVTIEVGSIHRPDYWEGKLDGDFRFYPDDGFEELGELEGGWEDLRAELKELLGKTSFSGELKS